MPLCNFCAIVDSWTAKCQVLCHLFRCFDPRFKEDILCQPAFVIRDINICRKGYSRAVSDICRLQTADYRLQTTDYRLHIVDLRP